MSEEKQHSHEDALSFLTEGGGTSAPILKKATVSGESSNLNPNELITALNEAVAQMGIDPQDRSVNEIITMAVSGLKGIGY